MFLQESWRLDISIHVMISGLRLGISTVDIVGQLANCLPKDLLGDCQLRFLLYKVYEFTVYLSLKLEFPLSQKGIAYAFGSRMTLNLLSLLQKDTNLSIFPQKGRTYFNKHDKQECDFTRYRRSMG